MAFTTVSKSGKTLKSILEDPEVPKCLWDVRNDADALWAHYHVNLAGVTDIQLLENASRADDKTYVRGLDKSIQPRETKNLVAAEVFAVRPMDAGTVQYCVNDVTYLPALHALYLKRMKGNWLALAIEQSARRLADAKSPEYDPQSSSKKLGPWGTGSKKSTRTLDEMLDAMEEDRMEDLAEDMFGYDDDVGYYDYDEHDDWGMNAADGAICPEAFDSCWDKN